MRYFLIVLLFNFTLNIHAQSAVKSDLLTGNYSAAFNGDNLVLSIYKQSGSSYTGIMLDSYQKYALTLEYSGSGDISGSAKEYSMGLLFDVSGRIEGDALPLVFSIVVAGERKDMVIEFVREGSGAPATGAFENPPAMALPIGASNPEDLIGTWVKEEQYQSGYGDSYMGAGFSQSMTFLSGGHLAEGGSSATISGSNYSGQSTGQGSGVLPGVMWYTIGNQLYMQVYENGQVQNIQLGTYYVEDNHMLITGTNGEKLLLSRSN